MTPRLIVGLSISVALTWLALRGTDLASIRQPLALLNPAVLAASLSATFVVMWIRALRWRLLLLGLGDASRSTVFSVTMIGYTANYIFPIRLGELVRAYLISRRERLDANAAFATVVVERVVDVFTVLVILGAVALTADLPMLDAQFASMLRAAALSLLALGTIVAGALWAMQSHRSRLAAVLHGRLGQRMPWVNRMAWRIEAFATGIAVIRTRRIALLFLIQTLAIWLASVAQIVLLLAGFDVHVPLEASWLILVSVAIGVALPAAPGLVGTFHYAAIVVLLIYNVARATALSFAIVLHGVSVFPVVLVGLFFVWQQGLSLRSLLGGKRRDPSNERAPSERNRVPRS